MKPIVYITLFFAPVIILMMWGYFSKSQGASYTGLLIRSFALGALGVLIMIAALSLSYVLGFNELRSLKSSLFFSFITVGLSSELGKFLVCRYLIIPKEQVDRPIDGITFSISTSMGFATLTLLLFVTNPIGIKDLYPYTLMPFIYVPATILFSVILGFFLGMGKFSKPRYIYSLTGLLCATFFHGLFTFCLVTDDFKLLSLFAFGSTIIVFILGLKAAYTIVEKS
jgi:RsiW-degrading membrane proteinase PrsW (M82 family)